MRTEASRTGGGGEGESSGRQEEGFREIYESGEGGGVYGVGGRRCGEGAKVPVGDDESCSRVSNPTNASSLYTNTEKN